MKNLEEENARLREQVRTLTDVVERQVAYIIVLQRQLRPLLRGADKDG